MTGRRILWAVLWIVFSSSQAAAQNGWVSDLYVLDSLVQAVVPLEKDSAKHRLWHQSMEDLKLVCSDSVVTEAFTPESWAGELVRLLSIWQDPHFRVIYPLPAPASNARLLALAPMGVNGLAGQRAWIEKYQGAEASRKSIELTFDTVSSGQIIGRLAIGAFDQGRDGQFYRQLRRAIRSVNRKDALLLLDLRGNTGGLSWRRHAVRSALGLVGFTGLSSPTEQGVDLPQEWTIRKHSFHSQRRVLRAVGISRERVLEKAQRSNTAWSEAASLLAPALGSIDTVRKVAWAGRLPKYKGRAAVLLDAVSFSAAVMLASELQSQDRFKVFGVPPLGRPDEMSGSSVAVRLPSTGLPIALPTTRSFFLPASPADFGLNPALTSDQSMQQARAWLAGEEPRRAHRVADALLLAIIEAFTPTDELRTLWTGAFRHASEVEDGLRDRIAALERSGAPEIEVVAQVGDWHKEIKAVRAHRDAVIRVSLTAQNQLKYDALRKPSRPDVRHFGLHDRQLCGLCVKPTTLIPTTLSLPTLKKNEP